MAILTNANYRAYLLRIWQAGEANDAGSDAVWQASLQDATTNQRMGFASLEALFAFLMNELEPRTELSNAKGTTNHEHNPNDSSGTC